MCANYRRMQPLGLYGDFTSHSSWIAEICCGLIDLWTDWIDSTFIVCKTYSIVPVNSQHNSIRGCSEHNLRCTIIERYKKFSTVMLLISKSVICPLLFDSTAFPQCTYYLRFSSKFRLKTNQYLLVLIWMNSFISTHRYQLKSTEEIKMYKHVPWQNTLST